MCELFRSVDPSRYEGNTHSIRLGGVSTSIRLEKEFWDILTQIAVKENCSVSRLLTNIYDEVIEEKGEILNFTSLLRVACIIHMQQRDEAVQTGSARLARAMV